MQWARASSAAACAAALLLAACADLDGLTGGTADGGGPGDAYVTTDGGGRPDAPASRDASAEASAGDAGSNDASADTPYDAPPDVATPIDSSADAGTWCGQQSPAPTFCADFDEASLTGGWNAVNQTNGTLTADSTNVSSPPHALLAATKATNANAMAQASLDYDPLATGSNVHFELELRVGTLDAASNVVVGGVSVGPTGNGNDAYHAFLVVAASGAFVEEAFHQATGEIYQDTPLSQSPAVGTYVHVALDLVLPTATGPAPTLTIRFDGNIVLGPRPLYGGGASGSLEIEVGASVYPTVNVGPNALDVDNVLLNVSP